MKARYNRVPKSEQKDYQQRTMLAAKQQLNDQFILTAYRRYGVAFLGLNRLGWGAKRLRRLWDVIGELVEEFAMWENDDVGDYILAKRLRECGADYIADAIDEFAEKAQT